jgi:hypothetical protein
VRCQNPLRRSGELSALTVTNMWAEQLHANALRDQAEVERHGWIAVVCPSITDHSGGVWLISRLCELRTRAFRLGPSTED